VKRVKDYWPGDFEKDLGRTLAWLMSRQNAPMGNWQGNALATATTQQLWQCGIVSGADLGSPGLTGGYAQVAIENIAFDAPTGFTEDETAGPDGFPINYSPSMLPGGQLILNAFTLASALTVTGRCLSLLAAASTYRVDIFAITDIFYYQGSSALVDLGGGSATWSLPLTATGTYIAVLYPISVTQPSVGWYGVTLPAGWKAHTNMGVGRKLVDFIGRVYLKTDIEYLEENNLPIIVQDSHHARVGSTKNMGSGTPTMHIIQNDPVAGWIQVFSTLQALAVFRDLPRSLDVPASDPFYVPDINATNSAVVQNRCWIYDAALAIVDYAYAGNHAGAQRMIAQLDALLDNPYFLASVILENAEDGLTTRWSKAGNAGASITNLNDPTQPPYGTGNVLKFHAAAAGDNFTFIGSGLPNSSDTMLEFQHREAAAVTFVIEVGVTTAGGDVTKFQFTSNGPGAETYNSGTKVITVPLGPGADAYRFVERNLATLAANLAGDTLSSIDSFKVTVNAIGDMRFDNFARGTLQPTGSLAFSYDVYYGRVAEAYIRTGAMAWVCYAYALYMEMTADYTAALYLQKMLDFLLTLEFTGSGLRDNLLQLGYGKYMDPGYQFVPGIQTACSMEHNVDAYFAFKRAARVLPTAATELLKRGLITISQMQSLVNTGRSVAEKADNIHTALMANLYIAPGADPGHFAQGVDSSGNLDTAVALDAAGSWAAIFCHEVADDAKATECLKFIYQKLFLTGKTIVKSNQSADWNMAYEQLAPFDGFTVYGAGYTNPPQSVWQEGTWGVINALLRCGSIAAVVTYFAAVEGSVDAFLTKLIRSQKTIWNTTGNASLVNYSLAARALPWEFSVWASMAATAWFWTTAWNPTLFLSINTVWELRPYLKVPQGVEQRIEQLEGRGSIGALGLEAIDGAGYMTALGSGGKLEGKKVSLKVGYPGMATADFVTVVSQQIESVAALDDYTGIKLTCRDLQRSAKSKVFLKGNDGFPISNQHSRTLSVNPIDLALLVFQNELGVGQPPGAPSSAWKIYDPARWSGGSNPTLLNPNAYLDLAKFIFYRAGIFAGYKFDFSFEQPVEAKQLLEYEVFKALGGYLIVLADGRLSPRFFVPPYSVSNLFSFSERNMTVLPRVERIPIINQVSYRMDYDGSKFQAEVLFVYAPSMQHYGLAGQQIIESKGMKLNRGGSSLAGITAERIFRRYAGFDPVSGLATGGAMALAVTSHYLTLAVEVGDFVYVNHPLLPNFLTGQRGVVNRIFEVVEKQPNFTEGTMTYKLLDAGWVAAKKLSKVPPNGTGAWTAATQAQRDKYMFACLNATKEYSDGTAGKTIW